MPETITGPGLGGGPSEIAAVSVGIYAIDHTGKGFAAVKTGAVAQAKEVGRAAGHEAGASFTDAHQKGILGALQNIGKLKRAFHHIIAGLFFAPLVVKEAFELGEKIGKHLFSGIEAENKRQEAADKTVESIGKKYTESNRKYVEDKAKREEQHEDRMFELRKRLNESIAEAQGDSVEKITMESDNKVEQLKREQLKTQDAEERAIIDQLISWEYQRRNLAIQDFLKRKEEEEKEADARIAKEQGNAAVDEFREAQHEKDVIAQQAEDASRRRRAASDHSLDNLTTDVAQLRHLVRINGRQRFPDPGSGEAQ